MNTLVDITLEPALSLKFDGYTGFAIYSSISQGLDEITYGGRRSRRNSITETNYGFQRRGSISGSAFEYSALVTAAASAQAMAPANRNDRLGLRGL